MPLKKSLAGVLVHAPRIERTWGSRPDFSPLDTGCPWRRATDPFPSPEGIHCLPRRADPQSSTFPSSTPWPGWGAEWTAATTPGQNLQLHCGSSSSPCWLHTLGRDAFILQVTGVFTRIRSRATLEVDRGGAYRSIPLRGAAVAAAVEQKGSGADLFGGSALIYKLSGGNTLTEWISARRVTQRWQPVFSPSSTRCSSPRGLCYVRSILWVTTSFKTHSGHILQSR
jgi:hypothetical protein